MVELCSAHSTDGFSALMQMEWLHPNPPAVSSHYRQPVKTP